MTNVKLAISSVSSELVIMIIDIVQECQGLPVALVAVGRSLRGKSAIEWTPALQLLKNSQPMSEEYAEENVFACLALSYDHLKNEETKSCFLMCSLFPEDHDIQIEHLARFLIKSGRGLNEWPRRETFEHVAISLMSNNVSVLPDDLNCPKLQMLLLEEEQGIISTGIGPSNRLVYNEGIHGRSNHLSPYSPFLGSNKYEEDPDILLWELRKINLKYLPKLQHIWNVIDPLSSTSHHRHVRPVKLNIIEIRRCGELKSVFPFFISQSLRQMEVLKVVECPNLERIVSKESEEMHIVQNPPTFPRLKVVHVEYCPKVTNLFSVRTAQSLLQLKELKVSEVFRLEELISNEENRKDEDLKIVLPKLKQLHISNVHIKRLCPDAVTIDLPSLEELVLKRCYNMKDFATDASKYGLESAPALIKLQIDEQILNGTLAQQIFRVKA
ncbi:hypothetical protein K7X08_021044 [Anisodus acutangulus]|uniref:Disease resistance protein At4g27190-like leucine-rich repeats domain-containing protein n=1 Tax=Anisodus acutangulus TaxID=402998 RepID=A0A9Q1M2A3_9SOLA|nr:hypothetical protein K7X08_021044 [Anisodus acutangulus]